MKKIYILQERQSFWSNYWEKIKEDANEINANEYPLHLVNKYIKENERCKIADIGCGLGRVLKHLHYKGYNVRGIDYVDYCIRKLKREDSRLNVRQANILDIPYEDNIFDIVMAFGILGHIENGMKKAFKEVNRILKLGGILAGSLCYNNFGRKIFQLTQYLKKLKKKKPLKFYTNLFTLIEIKNILKKHHFKLIEFKPVISREVLYKNFLFLRGKTKLIPYKLLRSNEKYYRLNFIGETIYRIIRKYFPFQYTTAISFIAKKIR